MNSRWAFFDHDEGCCGEFSCLSGSNLVLQIFAKLELRDLIRVRFVCKSWYDAILSPQFLKIWKDEEEQVWAVLALRSEAKESQEEFEEHLWYPVSSSSENHREIWYVSRSSSSFGKGSMRSLCMLPMPALPDGTKFEGLLSSQGLVLGRLMGFEEGSKRNIKLIVGNPITNSWKHLPLAPMPSNICPYDYHQFLIERDPVSANYIIVVFLSPSRVIEEVEGEDWFYVLQYESKSGTWRRGPTLDECSSTSHNNLLQGSMVGVDALGQDLNFSVYDPHLMAWSHLHIAFSWLLIEDDENWRSSHYGVIMGFKYSGKYFLTTSIFRLEGDKEDLGLGVWELDEEKLSLKLVSMRRYKDLYGAGWSSNSLNITWIMNWKCQFVGDHVIFSATYTPHTHGLIPPVAFNMHHFTWISALTEEEKCGAANFSPVIDYECAYAFIPSLAARV